MPSKIVIDTNVWISYFISKRFVEITQLIIDSKCQIFTCEELVNEIIDVISRKKFKNQVTFPIDFYIQLHEKLTTYQKIQIQFTGSPDPKDDFLFDLVIQTNSKILVTGDKKLLGFKNNNVETISLASFKMLKS
jgi:uncharacterized protein